MDNMYLELLSGSDYQKQDGGYDYDQMITDCVNMTYKVDADDVDKILTAIAIVTEGQLNPAAVKLRIESCEAMRGPQPKPVSRKGDDANTDRVALNIEHGPKLKQIIGLPELIMASIQDVGIDIKPDTVDWFYLESSVFFAWIYKAGGIVDNEMLRLLVTQALYERYDQLHGKDC